MSYPQGPHAARYAGIQWTYVSMHDLFFFAVFFTSTIFFLMFFSFSFYFCLLLLFVFFRLSSKYFVLCYFIFLFFVFSFFHLSFCARLVTCVLYLYFVVFAVPRVLEDSKIRRDRSAHELLPGSQKDRHVHRPQWPSVDGNQRRQW